MDKLTRQTERVNTKPSSGIINRIVIVFFSLIEILLVFRLFFKLLAANPANGFVKLIYNATGFFVKLFEGIFADVTIRDGTVTAILEPSTLIAIIVVAIVAWLVSVVLMPKQSQVVERTVVNESDARDNTNNQHDAN